MLFEPKKIPSISGSTAKKLRAITSLVFNLSFFENKRSITTGIKIWSNGEDIIHHFPFDIAESKINPFRFFIL